MAAAQCARFPFRKCPQTGPKRTLVRARRRTRVPGQELSYGILSYRELAEVGHVSRPRLSQIMQLAQLAPEIQEQVLFLPPTLEGPDRVFERQVRLIARMIDLDKQKELFRTFQDARESAGA